VIVVRNRACGAVARDRKRSERLDRFRSPSLLQATAAAAAETGGGSGEIGRRGSSPSLPAGTRWAEGSGVGNVRGSPAKAGFARALSPLKSDPRTCSTSPTLKSEPKHPSILPDLDGHGDDHGFGGEAEEARRGSFPSLPADTRRAEGSGVGKIRVSPAQEGFASALPNFKSDSRTCSISPTSKSDSKHPSILPVLTATATTTESGKRGEEARRGSSSSLPAGTRWAEGAGLGKIRRSPARECIAWALSPMKSDPRACWTSPL
jgi:hypothetical protein